MRMTAAGVVAFPASSVTYLIRAEIAVCQETWTNRCSLSNSAKGPLLDELEIIQGTNNGPIWLGEGKNDKNTKNLICWLRRRNWCRPQKKGTLLLWGQ
jgi:hypothetical protein